jgi:hypothetical protein
MEKMLAWTDRQTRPHGLSFALFNAVIHYGARSTLASQHDHDSAYLLAAITVRSEPRLAF